MNPPRSATTLGTAVARIVASIATSPVLSITARRIGPRSLRSPTSRLLIPVVVVTCKDKAIWALIIPFDGY